MTLPSPGSHARGQICKGHVFKTPTYIWKNKCTVILAMKLLTPRSGVQALGWGYNSHIVKMYLTFLLKYK